MATSRLAFAVVTAFAAPSKGVSTHGFGVQTVRSPLLIQFILSRFEGGARGDNPRFRNVKGFLSRLRLQLAQEGEGCLGLGVQLLDGRSLD